LANAPYDIVEEALNELTSLHADKPKFCAFITAILKQVELLTAVAEKMLLWRDIDFAEGESLLQIAEIVGAPRIFTDKLLSIFVGFDDQDLAMPLWDETNPAIEGGRWREAGETEITLANRWEAQRVVIRAQVLKNRSHGYTPEISESLELLFRTDMAFVQNNKDMSFDVNVGHILTPIEVLLIREYDILPRPAGVQIKDFVYWDALKHVFGFDHQTGTFGFDDGYFALGVMQWQF
jgi:hypothetical protein